MGLNGGGSGGFISARGGACKQQFTVSQDVLHRALFMESGLKACRQKRWIRFIYLFDLTNVISINSTFNLFE